MLQFHMDNRISIMVNKATYIETDVACATRFSACNKFNYIKFPYMYAEILMNEMHQNWKNKKKNQFYINK